MHFEQAIEHGLVDHNLAKRLGKFYKHAPVRHEEIQPLSPPEVETLVKAVLEHAPQHYALFLAAIHTGMRSGELAGLKWEDIDWKAKYVTVRRGIANGRVTQTKTARSRGWIFPNAVQFPSCQYPRRT